MSTETGPNFTIFDGQNVPVNWQNDAQHFSFEWIAQNASFTGIFFFKDEHDLKSRSKYSQDVPNTSSSKTDIEESIDALCVMYRPWN